VSNSAVTSVSASEAFVSLGAGTPAVLSIVQTAYANATRQTIALATSGPAPGQNELRVDIFSTTNNTAGVESTLADRSLNEEQITSEAQAALPGLALRRSLSYVQNQYGPFGYALAQAGAGELCMYAWQRIATPDLDVSLFNRRATMSIRLRLCQPGASETNLVAAMMGLHINASLSSGSWSKEPQQLSPDIGAAGVPMGPPASSLYTPSADGAAPAPRRRPVRRTARPAPPPQETQPTAAPETAAPPSGVVIPPPPVGGSTAAPSQLVPPPPLVPAPSGGASP
jgi:hypothetical protein